MEMTKESVYGKEIISENPKGSDIQQEIYIEPKKMTSEEFNEAITKYAENFKGQDENNYSLAKILARTTRNKRDHLHYFTLFTNLFLNNLSTQLGENKAEEVQQLKEKVNLLRNELANILKDVKVDDTGMMPYLIGMMEGLL